ncbi:tetratricopeptide repeat protein [Fulvivirgaceae bacterium BMA10]|uniref:Tetratricopeptide repeat protein n=2 Tax=Splendidivirga corallicola TaxID=3051826 RepID=A0ABT8KWV6_9BACT|nr:tetratricopeptide repeat protein [Fulvivirgaceae bacterium BMA10]
MKSSRLKQLLEFLKEDPNDAFTLYAIATEYKSTDPGKAKIYFDKLLGEHENYIGTYYHAAKLYAAMDLRDQAEEIFKKGIEKSLSQGNQHAHRELLSAYNEFLFEDEE